MARLAINWIEKNFDLPYRINSIEKDLSDGYLLIQILYKCGKVTDEELELCKGPSSTNDPGHALSNFKIVNRALKRWELGLDKKEVADILMEQPGAAAAVIMNIKRKKEMKPPPPYPAYKDAIKSLRPKEYKRQAIGLEPEDPVEKFGRDAIKTLEFGTFNEIDMRCQLHEYEVFKNTRDNIIKDEEKIEKEEFQKYRKELYDTMVFREKNIVGKNKEEAKALKTRWVKSFDVKNHRQVRDLQFELATLKVKELKTRNTNRFYDSEQNNGINEFERNLKRSGIGGGDENNQLATTYEDGMVFMNRIEDTAQSKWPTNAEVGDFISQLKQRTAEKAAARYDKARRRRRMLVDQKSSNAASVIDEGDDGDEKEDAKVLETVMKMQQKEERYQTMLKECKESMDKNHETAEENIRIFAEQFRLLADEEADIRSQELAKILETRKSRIEERRQAATTFCREIVINLIADSLDGPSTRPQTAQTSTTNGGFKTSKLPTAPTNMNSLLAQNPLQLTKNLFEFIRSRLDPNNYVSELSLDEIMTLDIWPAFLAIASNIGNWSAEIITEIENEINEQETDKVEETEPNAEESNIEKAETNVEQKQPTRIVKLSRQLSFAESMQSILESLLHEYHVSLNPSPGISSNIDKALELSSSERTILTSKLEKETQTILILNGVNEAFITQNCFSKITGMIGATYQGVLWDCVSSIEAASKIAPLLEGKTVTLNFPSLFEIFEADYISGSSVNNVCPEELSNITLSPQVLRVATDMVEAATRVLNMKGSVTDGTFNISNCPFIDTTLAILLGQGLWMRNFIIKQFAQAGIVCPIPSLAIVSSIISNKTNIKHASSYSLELFVTVFNWFYRGGSRDNIPADNSVLVAAIQEENAAAAKGAAKGKGKPPAKGKGPEEELAERSSLASVIHIDQVKNETSTVTYSKDPTADDVTPYDIIAEFASQKPVAEDTRSALEIFAKANNINCFTVSLKDTTRKTTTIESVVETAETSEPKESADVEATPDTAPAASQKSLIFCNELSFMEISLAIMLAESTTSDIDSINRCIETRRGFLSPASKLWLLHSCQSNTLDMNSVFTANDSLYNLKSTCLEFRGILSMVFAVSVFNIEKTIKRQESEFISTLKSIDDRWKDICKVCAEKCKSSPAKDANILLGDLICRLGDIIDDRHVKWIDRNTELRHESMAEFYRLCKTLQEIKQQIGNSMFESLEAGKQSILIVSSILENAAYTELPWQLKYYSPNSRIQLERYRDNLRAMSALFDEKLGIAGASEDDDVWKSFASVEVPSSSSPLGSVKASLLTDLYTENLDVSISWLSAIMAGMESISKSLEQADLERQKYIHMRHAYEHKSLSQWATELRADAAPSSYLEKYSFSVSSLESYDQIPVPGGLSVVELNDMKINLNIVKVLSEELNLKLEENINENTTVNNRKKASSIFSETIASLLQKGQQLPQTLRDTKKFQRYFIQNLLLSPSDTYTIDNQKEFIKSVVLCLVFASVPSLPHLEYIVRISKILGRLPTADIEDISISFNEENRLSLGAFITKLMSDSVIATGWWPNADDQSISNIFTAIASCCLDSKKKVISEEFILSLCRSPHLLDTVVFEKSILLQRNMDVIMEETSPTPEVLTALPSLLNDGIFKAMKVASMTKGLPIEDSSSCYSQSFQLHQKLYGTSKWIDKIQLDWIAQQTNVSLSLESQSKIFSKSVFGLREQKNVKDENIESKDIENNTENSIDVSTENIESNNDNNENNAADTTPVQDTTNDNINNDPIIVPYEIEGNTRALIADVFISQDTCSMFSSQRNLLKRRLFRPVVNKANDVN